MASLRGMSSPPLVHMDLRRTVSNLLKNGTLKTDKGFPHGMITTQAETINTDLLAFLKAGAKAAAD
jgi:non-heme chloroperoxidase